MKPLLCLSVLVCLSDMDSAPSAAPSSSGRERKPSARAVEAAANAKVLDDSVFKARVAKVRPEGDPVFKDDSEEDAGDSDMEGLMQRDRDNPTGSRGRKPSARAVEAAANAKERSDSVSKARRGKVRPDADPSYSDEAEDSHRGKVRPDTDPSYSDEADDSETEGQKRQRVAPAAARSGSARKELAGLALPAGVKSPPKEIAPKEVACLALAEGETVEVCFVRQGKKLWRSGTVVTVENQAGTCVAFVKSEQFSEVRASAPCTHPLAHAAAHAATTFRAPCERGPSLPRSEGLRVAALLPLGGGRPSRAVRASGPSGIMGEGAECEGRELAGIGTCSDGVGVPGVGVDSCSCPNPPLFACGHIWSLAAKPLLPSCPIPGTHLCRASEWSTCISLTGVGR